MQKCLQRFNYFGYVMKRPTQCNFDSSWHERPSPLGMCSGDGRYCEHHEPLYDEFEAIVQEIRINEMPTD